MSFQGARPIEFKLTRQHIEAQAQGANARFDRVELKQSFRTAPRILQLVDRVFANPAAADGVTLDDGELVHVARRQDMDGVVELWPLVQVPDAPERLAWDAPRDRITADHPAVLLAEKIAREIVGWLRSAPASKKLKLLVVLDEARGFLPAAPYNPASKRPICTLLAQGRAQG
jgi:ATP-dependent helicase/nuclease subunit A